MAKQNPLPLAMLEKISETFRAMGDVSRLEILQTLMAGPCTVSEVVSKTGKGQANVSKHLAVLLAAGLASRKKQGTQAIYEIADPMVYSLCDVVCGSLRTRLQETLKAQQRVLAETTPGKR
jgi:DNA-binding transcriptional ArsR family regulator